MKDFTLKEYIIILIALAIAAIGVLAYFDIINLTSGL